MMKVKRLTVLFLLLCIICTSMSFTVAAESPAPDAINGFVIVDYNEKVALYTDYRTAQIAILNRSTGKVWYSNPQDLKPEEIVSGSNSDDYLATMRIEYINSKYFPNYITSSSKLALLVSERMDKSILYTYYFLDGVCNFAIPMKISLGEDFAQVDILFDEIEEYTVSRIIDVVPYPMMGFSDSRDNGYFLIPDGMGALMEFNTKFKNTYLYTEPIYSNGFSNITGETPFASMPLVGYKVNNDAMLAVINQGETLGRITTLPADPPLTRFNTVYISARYRNNELKKSTLSTKGTTNDKRGMFFSTLVPEAFILRYYPLEKEDSGYMEMADRYRNYLIKDKGMEKLAEGSVSPLFIETLGAYKTKKQFIGIPYDAVEPVTTYNDVETMISHLNGKGVEDIVINYNGWANGGIEDTLITKLNPERVLGGGKGFNALLDLDKKDDKLHIFFSTDLMRFYRSSFSNSKYNTVVQNLTKEPWYAFNTDASGMNKTAMYHVVKPQLASKFAKEFTQDSLNKGSLNIGLSSMGIMSFPAYNENEVITRDEAANLTEQTLKDIKAMNKDISILVNTGAGFAAPYVDYIYSAPSVSSRTVFLEKQVPFYQLVYRGYVNLSGPVVNTSSEDKELRLLAIETGTSLAYMLIGVPSENLQGTRFDNLYACYYKQFIDSAADTYNTLKETYKAIGNSAIIGHETKQDKVKMTTFENGVVIYTNYNLTPVVVDGKTIGAQDFIMVGGAK